MQETGAMEKNSRPARLFLNSGICFGILWRRFQKIPMMFLISTTDTLWQYNHVSQQTNSSISS